jgi:hypothetical protein
MFPRNTGKSVYKRNKIKWRFPFKFVYSANVQTSSEVQRIRVSLRMFKLKKKKLIQEMEKTDTEYLQIISSDAALLFWCWANNFDKNSKLKN